MIDAKLKEKLLGMTWDDLRKWADPRSVERGRRYIGNVDPPIVLADGSVAAKVHGSETYYTRLSMGPNGELKGVCTCPVGYTCKHAVALALAASKALQEKDGIEDAGRMDKGWKSGLAELDCLAGVADEEAENEAGNEWDDALGYVAELGERELRDFVKWNVVDQVLPLPYTVGSDELDAQDWISTFSGLDGTSDSTATIRRHSTLRAGADFKSTRLVGRSAWNDKWIIVIPASAIDADREKAMNLIESGVKDIKLGVRAYARHGN